MNQIIDSDNTLASAVAELNTYNQKRSRSFCDTYIFEPEAPREAPCGKLFVMIEIEENSKKASQVAEAIATIAQFEYYKNQQPGMVANFEAALAKVNEVLSEIAEHGEISWVGKIHAVIAAAAGHQLAVSQTGHVKTYLLRNGQPMEIGDENTAPHTNAVRTFDSIATGDLLPHDHLVFTNSALLNSLSLSRIESFLEQNPVLSSARQAENTLDKTLPQPACALLVKIDTAKAIEIENSKDEKYADLTPEELSQEPPTKKIQNVYDDIRSRTWAVKGLSGLKAAGRGVKVAGLFAANAGKSIVEGIRGKAKNAKPGEAKPLHITESRDEDDIVPEIHISDQDRPIKKAPEVSYPLHVNSEKAKITEKILEDVDLGLAPKKKFAITAIWTTTFSKIKNLPSTLKKMPRVSQVLLITSASLLIVFMVSIGIFSTNKAQQAKAAAFKSTLDQATTKYNSAVASLIYKNTSQATSLLGEAETLNKQVLGSSYFNSDAAALQDKINQEKDRIVHINDVQGVTKLTSFGDTSTTLASLLTDGSTLFGVTTDNKVYSTTISGTSTKLLSPKYSGGDGQYSQANYCAANSSILLLTDRNIVAEFKPSLGVINDLNTLGAETIADITSYGTRYVYFLEPSANNIFRMTKTTAGLGKPTAWIKDSNVSLSGAVSFAIDGSIYILSSNGTVQKFLNGVHDDYNLPALKTALNSPTKIITNEKLKNVYILDPKNKRIVVTTKTGGLVKELTSENFDGISGLVVNEAKSTAYVSSKNVIYSFPLVLQ